jgi:hypothetical protein
MQNLLDEIEIVLLVLGRAGISQTFRLFNPVNLP